MAALMPRWTTNHRAHLQGERGIQLAVHESPPAPLPATKASGDRTGSGPESLTTVSALASPAKSDSEDIQECPETIVQIARHVSAELLLISDPGDAANTPKSTCSPGAASSGMESLTTASALASPAMSDSEDIEDCSETIVQIARHVSAELLRASDPSFNCTGVVETLEYKPEPVSPSPKSKNFQEMVARCKFMLTSAPGVQGSPRGSSSWEYPLAAQETRHRLILVSQTEVDLAEDYATKAKAKNDAMRDMVDELRAERRSLWAEAQLLKAHVEEQARLEEQMHKLLLGTKRPVSLKTKQLQRKVRARVQRLRAEGVLTPKVQPKRRKPETKLPQ